MIVISTKVTRCPGLFNPSVAQEVLCDLVLVESILRLTSANVTLHVKDAPVFVSDVTEEEKLGRLLGRVDEVQGSSNTIGDNMMK